MNALVNLLKNDPTTKIKQCKKGELLQKQGEVSSRAFYVKKGLLKSYIIDAKGKEHIFMFASEGWIIADVESQEFKSPAELFIDCIEAAEVFVFERSMLTALDLTKDQLKINAELLARRVAVLQRRVLLLMSASALQRYERFLETYPQLPNRIPQKMIASYLGITPEALSKIRGKIVQNKP